MRQAKEKQNPFKNKRVEELEDLLEDYGLITKQQKEAKRLERKKK